MRGRPVSGSEAPLSAGVATDYCDGENQEARARGEGRCDGETGVGELKTGARAAAQPAGRGASLMMRPSQQQHHTSERARSTFPKCRPPRALVLVSCTVCLVIATDLAPKTAKSCSVLEALLGEGVNPRRRRQKRKNSAITKENFSKKPLPSTRTFSIAPNRTPPAPRPPARRPPPPPPPCRRCRDRAASRPLC